MSILKSGNRIVGKDRDYRNVLMSDGDMAEYKGFRLLLDYWNSKRGDRKYPSKKDINPADLKPVLPGMFIFSLIREGDQVVDLRVSLMGTQLTAHYGEISNQRLSDYPHPEIVKRILGMVRCCLEQKKPVAGIAQAMSKERQYMSVHTLYLPFSEDGETIDRVIGQVVLEKRRPASL